jgi:hypothetical protein
VQYAGTNYGQDISNELQNKIPMTIVEPVHTDDVLVRHGVIDEMIPAVQLKIQLAIKAQQTILQAAVTEGLDVDAPIKLAILQNEISQGEIAANIDIPAKLTDSEKTQFISKWRSYLEHSENLVKHKGQAFSLMQGQCTQLLQDKMNQDPDCIIASRSYDPLTFY